MANKPFAYKVNLVPLNIPNDRPDLFREELYDVPYLLYEVETLADGNKIVINKPGGKRNFGRLSRDDFMVFIYDTIEETLWLISHSELYDDLMYKKEHNFNSALKIVKGLFAVCCGAEPDDVIIELSLKNTVGLPVDVIYKVYKWIWGQEDCNYPNKKGRWMSMEAILDAFDVTPEDLE